MEPYCCARRVWLPRVIASVSLAIIPLFTGCGKPPVVTEAAPTAKVPPVDAAQTAAPQLTTPELPLATASANNSPPRVDAKPSPEPPPAVAEPVPATPVTELTPLVATPAAPMELTKPGKAKIGTTGRGADSLVWSRDGKRLAVIASRAEGGKSQVQLIDVASGIVESYLGTEARLLAMSPDGQTLAISTAKHSIEFWSWKDQKPIPRARTTPQKKYITEMAFSADGQSLYSGSYGTTSLQQWDTTTGKLLKEFSLGDLKARQFATARSGHLIAALGDTTKDDSPFKNEIRICDLRDGTVSRTIPYSDLETSAALSSDGKLLAVGFTYPARLCIWDTETGELVKELMGHGKEISSIEFFRGDQLLVSASHDKTVRIWDIASGESKATLVGSMDNVSTVSMAPQSPWLASGDREGIVHFWNVDEAIANPSLMTKTGNELRSWVHAPDGGMLHFDVSQDGKYLVSQSQYEARLAEIETQQLVQSIKQSPLGWPPVAMKPDGSQMAVLAGDFSVQLYSVPNGEPVQRLANEQIMSPGQMTYTPDGKRLILAADKFVFVWDMTNYELLKTWEADKKSIDGMDLTRDGQKLATGGSDGKVTIWDMKTFKAQKTIKVGTDRVMSIAFTTDETLIATSTMDGPLAVWNVATGKQMLMLAPNSGRLDALMFLPNSNILVVPPPLRLGGRPDLATLLMDVHTGKTLKQLKGHASSVMTIRYLPEQKLLLTGDSDGTIKFWDIDPATLK